MWRRLAIAELISGMKKPTVSLVLGGGHSIGIPLAVSGRVTMIAPSASMTIHPVRTSGTIIAAPQTYQYFTRLQESIVRFVARSSRISEEKFRELMLHGNDMASDVGTVVYGEEAVQLGLIDRVGQLKGCLRGSLRHACESCSPKSKALPLVKPKSGTVALLESSCPAAHIFLSSSARSLRQSQARLCCFSRS